MRDPGSRSLMDWLLDEEQPSVVYHVLKDVLGKRDGEERVRRALAAVPERGWAADLLADQKPRRFLGVD